MSNFYLFIARFLYHLQKFYNIHNAAHFPSFPLIPTPLLCNQHKPLQKNHWQLLLTFESSFSFAHIQTDGLNRNIYVVTLMSFLVVYHWLDCQCQRCHGMNTPTKLQLGLIVLLEYTRVLLHFPFFCIYKCLACDRQGWDCHGCDCQAWDCRGRGFHIFKIAGNFSFSFNFLCFFF